VGHSFGGPWTEDKLGRIDEYLDAYMTIFTANPRAAALRTTYLDAFAGTGSAPPRSQRTAPKVRSSRTPWRTQRPMP
jgi:hypothetical protein